MREECGLWGMWEMVALWGVASSSSLVSCILAHATLPTLHLYLSDKRLPGLQRHKVLRRHSLPSFRNRFTPKIAESDPTSQC